MPCPPVCVCVMCVCVCVCVCERERERERVFESRCLDVVQAYELRMRSVCSAYACICTGYSNVYTCLCVYIRTVHTSVCDVYVNAWTQVFILERSASSGSVYVCLAYATNAIYRPIVHRLLILWQRGSSHQLRSQRLSYRGPLPCTTRSTCHATKTY